MNSTIPTNGKATLLRYAELGWRLVPIYEPTADGCSCGKVDCGSPGKHPRVKEWQKAASSDPQQIEQWAERWPETNWGFQLGPDGGVIDIEGDSEEAIETLHELFGGDPPPCPTYRSARGFHRLFAWRDDLPAQATFSWGGVDFKLGANQKGSQSVLPPSRHASGVDYRWDVPPWDVPPPPLPDSALQKILAWKAERTRRPKPAPTRLPPAGDDNRLERCRKYIAKMPDAVSGEGGHDATFAMACKLFEFGLNDAQAWGVACEFNQAKCKGPWTEADLRHKLDDAKERVASEGRFGCMLVEDSGPVNSPEATGRPRGPITNARPSREGKGMVALGMAEILQTIHDATGGFPRFAGGDLFVYDKQHGLATIKNAAGLFGWLTSRCGVNWHRTQGCIPKEEVFAELQRTAHRYRAIEVMPHHPHLADHFYACETPASGDGETLRELLGRFRPATTIDGDLILAALLTPFWGGRPGARPCFVFTTDEGRGVGKTTAATMLAEVADPEGELVAFDQNAEMGDIKKRLLSSAGIRKRVAILDNIKSLRFSWGDLEALLTMPVISGHKMYVGEGTRPNVLTWYVTLNGASLSTDMAQRAIIIKLAKPKRAKLWEDETRQFIHERRRSIIADLLGILRQKPGEVTRPARWATWEREVLARLPEPNDAQAVYLERQREVDAEGEAGEIIEDYFAARLHSLDYDVARDVVFIPSTVAAQWYAQSTGEKHNVTGVSKILRQMIAEQQLSRLVLNASRAIGRGFLWYGDEAAPDAAKQTDIGTRLRIEKQGNAG